MINKENREKTNLGKIRKRYNFEKKKNKFGWEKYQDWD
jgi:hypothetical protein